MEAPLVSAIVWYITQPIRASELWQCFEWPERMSVYHDPWSTVIYAISNIRDSSPIQIFQISMGLGTFDICWCLLSHIRKRDSKLESNALPLPAERLFSRLDQKVSRGLVLAFWFESRKMLWRRCDFLFEYRRVKDTHPRLSKYRTSAQTGYQRTIYIQMVNQSKVRLNER